MCIQEPSPPSSPEPTNSEPMNSEPLNSEPQPPPEPAPESRKRSMPEPYTSEPTPKPKHHGVSSSTSTRPPPPPSSSTPFLNPVESTEDLVEDMFKFIPMPLEELNRQSPSRSSTLPQPPPISDELFKFLPMNLFDDLEPLNTKPLNTIFPIQDENYSVLEPVRIDWTPPFARNIDDRISDRADPVFTNEPMALDFLDSWEAPETSLRRRKVSAVVSSSINYVPVDHDGNTDVPIPTPRSKLVGAGIENLVNTCFMASILQCLTHTGGLYLFIRYYSHDASSCRRGGGFCVICAFSEHNARAFHIDRNPIRPDMFLQNVKQFSDNFVAHRQEDAHEFLIGALNNLRSAFQKDGSYDIIEQIFGGEIVSQLRCCSCGFSSNTVDPILDLGLAVENVSTIQRALDAYIMVENMGEMLKCSNCDQQVYKEKQLLIDKAPEVAVLHLKRFKNDGSSFEKINHHVYFTMELDLEPYTSAKGKKDPMLKYDLYAVVVHSGSTANSGHYFSYVRSDEDHWHLMDDAAVYSVSKQHVLIQEAYMLFYAKQGTAWFSSILKHKERDFKATYIDNTRDSDRKEKDVVFIDLEATESDSPEANDDDSMRANNSDSPKLNDDYSMRADDSNSMYGFNSDSPDGNEKTSSDMLEEEECDLAGANDKDSKDADDNDSKATNEMSVSDMEGEECDLADANDDKDSKDVNVKSVSGMAGEECDLADANDKDSKDANDKDSKDANEKSVSGMDGADGNDSKDANANDSSVSRQDGEECDLGDANDKDSKDANEKPMSGMDGADDNDSKDTNANDSSVSSMDREECDLADANDKDSKDANEKSVSGMDGADDNDSKDANANDSSMSSKDGEECDLADANDKDSKDANEKSVSGMDGADDNDSKDANANDSSVSSKDGEECDLVDANANDSSVSSKDGEGCDLVDANANDSSVSSKDGEECDLVDANANDSSVSSKDGEGCDLVDANANDSSVSSKDGEECDLVDANANDSSVSSKDGEECDLVDANDKDSQDANDDNDSDSQDESDDNDSDSQDANDDNDSKIANERLGSDMGEDDVIPQS
ncbi:uncharacterized protein LOC131619064 [Vicia villosa]|uniref:uncharacterized protein LOC131619064 n=1 Tax=Vicia villosa TaxID=3911 RepID=UPI00273A853F|nr:uncharacterized protein LOC131619064 [Vicia villosa]